MGADRAPRPDARVRRRRDRAVSALEAGYREGLVTAAELRVRTGRARLPYLRRAHAATAVLATRRGRPSAAKRITPKVVAGSACAIVLRPPFSPRSSLLRRVIILCCWPAPGYFASGALIDPRRPGHRLTVLPGGKAALRRSADARPPA